MAQKSSCDIFCTVKLMYNAMAILSGVKFLNLNAKRNICLL